MRPPAFLVTVAVEASIDISAILPQTERKRRRQYLSGHETGAASEENPVSLEST